MREMLLSGWTRRADGQPQELRTGVPRIYTCRDSLSTPRSMTHNGL